MVTTGPILPADVVRLILEAAHITPDHTLWDEYGLRRRVAWFASTLRVSRTWYIAGQKALYHRIKIVADEERSNDLLIRTLTRRPHIAQMVKALHIQSPYGRLRHCRKGIPQLGRLGQLSVITSIPFATQLGRRDLRAKRQQKKPVQLLRLCTGVTELSLEKPDLTLLTPILDSIRASIERLTIVGAHAVSSDQWESMSQSTFWRNLRSIQLLAVDPVYGTSVYSTIGGLDLAFIGAGPFTCLEKLEIVGYVPATALQRIVDIVRPTLTTLQIDQTREMVEMCLSPTSVRLRNTGLSVPPVMRLVDLSLFARLEHLTFTMRPKIIGRRINAAFRLFHSLPSSISVFELLITDRFNPWRAASDIALILHAFNIGTLPNLRRIIASIEIQELNELGKWTTAAFLLTGVAKRHSLEFRLDVRFKPQERDAYRFNCFARARHELEKARAVKRAELDKRNGPPGPGVCILSGLLLTATLAYFCLCCLCCFLT